MDKNEIKQELIRIVGNDAVLTDTLMRDHTSFRVGGPADFLVLPETDQHLRQVLGFCRREEIPFYLMGNGSNLLVGDGGYHGVIVKTRGMDSVTVARNTVVAEAGALLRKVAFEALAAERTGLEFASGIPGSIGGAVVMNAGAYDGEMKDVVESVTVLTEEGKYLSLANDECEFGYRQSIIQKNPWTVTRVNLRLRPGDYNSIKEKMDDLNRRRREKQPLNYPSAGSTFRRPKGYFAGKLIQDAGLRGFAIGGAQVSEKHTGFVINTGEATARDVRTLIAEVQRRVKASSGVELHTEVIMIGEP